MKFKFPVVKNAQVTSITYTSIGSIKRMIMESSSEEIEVSGVALDLNAEIVVNRLMIWGEEPK